MVQLAIAHPAPNAAASGQSSQGDINRMAHERRGT
jgi:hypothetical protein